MQQEVFVSGKELKEWTRGQVFIVDVGLDFKVCSAQGGQRSPERDDILQGKEEIERE